MGIWRILKERLNLGRGFHKSIYFSFELYADAPTSDFHLLKNVAIYTTKMSGRNNYLFKCAVKFNVENGFNTFN